MQGGVKLEWVRWGAWKPWLGASSGAGLHGLWVSIFPESPEEPLKDMGHSLSLAGPSGPPGSTRSHLPCGLRQELTMLASAPSPGPLRNLLRSPPQVVGGSDLGEPSWGTRGIMLSPYQIDSGETEAGRCPVLPRACRGPFSGCFGSVRLSGRLSILSGHLFWTVVRGFLVQPSRVCRMMSLIKSDVPPSLLVEETCIFSLLPLVSPAKDSSVLLIPSHEKTSFGFIDFSLVFFIIDFI